MLGKVLGRSAIVAAALCAMAPAQATSFVFTSSTNTATSGAFGNAITLAAVDGITVTATAWSAATTSATPTAAYLGRYTNGLGVTNSAEGNGDTASKHTIDNVDGYDFVRLVFSKAVSLTGVNKVNYSVNGAADGDYWVSYGGTGVIDSSTWGGYTTRGSATIDSSSNYSNSNFSTVWLVGAARTTEKNDGFKLSTISANATPPVPEPATWMMMILGFGAMGTVVRKQARLKAKIMAFMSGSFGRKLLTGPASAA